MIVFKGNTTLIRNRASWKGAGAYGGVAGELKHISYEHLVHACAFNSHAAGVQRIEHANCVGISCVQHIVSALMLQLPRGNPPFTSTNPMSWTTRRAAAVR